MFYYVHCSRLDAAANYRCKLGRRSQYEVGKPPLSGTYEILADGRRLTFKMAWVETEGESHTMDYSELCDGEFHDYPLTEIAGELRLSLQNGSLLESEARKNGKSVLLAARELISDTEMKVTMSRISPEGKLLDNVARYAR